MAMDITIIEEYITKVKNKAGPRYIPELNVELPILDIFDSISRTHKFYEEIRREYGELLRSLKSLEGCKEVYDFKDCFDEIRKKLKFLFFSIESIKSYNSEHIDWENIHKSSETIEYLFDDFIRVIRHKEDELRQKDKKTKSNKEQHFQQRRYGNLLSYIIRT